MSFAWFIDEYGALRLDVPTLCRHRGEGVYEIHVQRRPDYCDRGDWMIYMDGRNNDIDGADGFPRYFFGDVEAVKAQVETWVKRRKLWRNRALQSATEGA